jgi:hypothetical protein
MNAAKLPIDGEEQAGAYLCNRSFVLMYNSVASPRGGLRDIRTRTKFLTMGLITLVLLDIVGGLGTWGMDRPDHGDWCQYPA